MKAINYVCNKVLNVLQANNIICKKDEAFYRYGLEILLNNMILDMTIILTGLITRMFTITIVFFTVFIGLRSLTGGYHASKRWKCFCLTNILHIVVLFLVAQGATLNTINICFLCNIVSIIIVWLKAPIVGIHCMKDEGQVKRTKYISRVIVVFICMWELIDIRLFGKCSLIYFAITITLLEVAILLAIRKGENK